MATIQLASDSLETKDAGADLTGQEGKLAVLNGSGQAVLAGAADRVYGIINEGATAGRAVTLHVRGQGKCLAGGIIAVGASVGSDASGLAVASGAAFAFGTARTAGVAGKMIEVALDRHVGV